MPANELVKIKITNIDGQVNNFQIGFCFFIGTIWRDSQKTDAQKGRWCEDTGRTPGEDRGLKWCIYKPKNAWSYERCAEQFPL